MASVKKCWIKKYGEEEGLRRWSLHKKSYGKTKEQLAEKYGMDYVNDLSNRKRTFTEEHYIEKYGQEEGSRKWKEVLDKKLKTQENNFKDKPWKNGRTLLEYQERYGVDEGYKKWKERNRVQSYKVSKQRYIDEYGVETGEKICKSIKDNSSLQKYIDRYGIEDGRKRYEEKNKKCAITLPKMVAKYGEDLGRIKYKEWIEKATENSFSKIGVSKSSQELFWSIYNKLNETDKDKVHFFELNGEYKFFQHFTDFIKLHRVDFKFDHKIIEFDCEYWHNKVEDDKRDIFLSSHGYKVYRVDYQKFITNKEEIVNNCLDFLYERA